MISDMSERREGDWERMSRRNERGRTNSMWAQKRVRKSAEFHLLQSFILFYFIIYFIVVFSYLTYFLAQGSEEKTECVGNYMEAVALAFQIIDDVTNLRGFQGGAKIKGEDITAGLKTLPSLLSTLLFLVFVNCFVLQFFTMQEK
jgi:hypothetical protein